MQSQNFLPKPVCTESLIPQLYTPEAFASHTCIPFTTYSYDQLHT